MTISDASTQALIILEVGDEMTATFPGGILAANIATIWARYADQAAQVREQLVKRGCIDLVLGVVRGQVDFEIANDHSRKQSQKTAALLKLRAEVEDAIVRLVGADSASGLLTTTTPIAPDSTSSFDPSGRAYRGDPLRRRWPV